MKDIIYIKNIFPSLFLKKIVKVNDIFNILKLVKSCIKIVIKKLSRKQIIISINQSNTSVIINHTNTFIRNINNCLYKYNSNIITDFIRSEDYKVVIITN